MTEAVEKHIKKLQRLDKKDELEVEHLLKVLKTPSKKYIAPLREMAEQWKNDPPPQEGVLFVPYAEWVEAIRYEKNSFLWRRKEFFSYLMLNG